MNGKMMGRVAWFGSGCTCCNGPRTRGQVRTRERRTWRRDWN